MEITDVRIKLVRHSKERLKAFCTVTFDEEFVVRDIKIVDGANGLFVAMPSRKLAVPCPRCSHKNHLRAHYCEDCGTQLPEQQLPADNDGRAKLYTDVAHPITQAFREKLQNHIIEAFQASLDDDEDIDIGEESDEHQETERESDGNGRESDDERPSDDDGGGSDDYRSLIADLRGEDRGERGRAAGGRGERSRTSSPRTDESRPRRGRSHGRGRRDDQSPQESRRGRDRNEPARAPAAETAKPVAKPPAETARPAAKPPAETARPAAKPPAETARPAAKPLAETARPAAKPTGEVPLAKPAVLNEQDETPVPAAEPAKKATRVAEQKAPPPSEELDDSSPFGAGIV